MTHDEVQALAAEYVLKLTDEVTTARVAAHLAQCEVCRHDMRDVATVFDAIGRSVPAEAPPVSLRERIVAIPSAVPQASAVIAPARPVVEASSSSGMQGLPWLAAVAAALVAAVALWQTGTAHDQIERLQLELTEARQDADQARVAQAALQQRIDEFSHQGAVLRASDLMAFELKGQPGAHARAYVTHKDGMVFTADGLPALPAGKVYQLWVIVDDTPVSVGVFAPDDTGRVNAVMDTPAIGAMPGSVAVTLEPTGGLPKPSSAPILVGLAQS